MKKLLVIVLLLVVVAVLGGPILTANIAKDGLQQQVAQLNDIPGYSAELVNYDKGWFSATTQLRIGIDETMYAGTPGTSGIGDLSLLFDMNIVHGPLLLGDETGVGLVSSTGTLNEDNMPAVSEFREKAGLDTLVTYHQVTDLLGVSHYTSEVPAFEASDANGRIAFGGMNITGDFDLKANTMTGNGTIGQLEISGQGSTVVLEPMHMNFDMEILNWMVQLGSQEFVIPGMKVYQGSSDDGEPMASFSNARLVSNADSDGEGSMGMTMTVAMETLNAQGVQLQDFNLDMAFEKISLKAIEQFGQLYKDAMANAADPQLMQLQLASGSTAVMPVFLENSPVFAIPDLSFKLNGEPLTANARIAVDAEGLDTTTVMLNPQPLLQKLAANLNLEISDALMQQFGAMLGPQVAMMQKTETGYQIKFDMKDGAATLNGQPLPPLF
ncbi:DUF945 family protein [Porticoccus sp. GXU_MW_L64]